MLSEQALLTYKHLQATYRASLKDKNTLLQGHWQEFERSEHPAAALKKLRLFVHRLAGSAAPYGYKNLSSIAREVEILINEYTGANSAHSLDEQMEASIREQLRNVVTRLITALDDAFFEQAPG
ncbi:MAG: Hpt domain-containing protein [Pseudomonadota bacterium]